MLSQGGSHHNVKFYICVGICIEFITVETNGDPRSGWVRYLCCEVFYEVYRGAKRTILWIMIGSSIVQA